MRHQPASLPGRAHRHRFESPFWRRVMLWGIQSIPRPVQIATMPMWAGIFYGLVPSARRTVEANLRRVLGDAPRPIVHARSFRLFVNYAQSLTDMYAAYTIGRLPADAHTTGREKMFAAQARGNGVVIATGHLGSWALGPFLLDSVGIGAPVMAMAEEPNAAVHEFEQRFRKRFRIVYTTGSPFAALELAALLRRGEAVAMQIDRPTGGATIDIPFCGRPAPFPIGPATLARAARAPIVPVFMVREGFSAFRATVEDPIDVPRTRDRKADVFEATTRLVKVYEDWVHRFPYQWFNFHDFWAPPPALPAPTTSSPLGPGQGPGQGPGSGIGVT